MQRTGWAAPGRSRGCPDQGRGGSAGGGEGGPGRGGRGGAAARLCRGVAPRGLPRTGVLLPPPKTCSRRVSGGAPCAGLARQAASGCWRLQAGQPSAGLSPILTTTQRTPATHLLLDHVPDDPGGGRRWRRRSLGEGGARARAARAQRLLQRRRARPCHARRPGRASCGEPGDATAAACAHCGPPGASTPPTHRVISSPSRSTTGLATLIFLGSAASAAAAACDPFACAPLPFECPLEWPLPLA